MKNYSSVLNLSSGFLGKDLFEKSHARFNFMFMPAYTSLNISLRAPAGLGKMLNIMVYLMFSFIKI